VGESVWLNTTDRKSSTCEATSIANARAIVAASPGTRVFIYHNMCVPLWGVAGAAHDGAR